ncbi:ran GTPase activating protein 1 [Niveomyces insectorum RCEF 264]|uniref:Ran GTPase activating protein 1 n=1 Tax=Niveomyces insectorum RCEF 264 TaxID=1081102 RepID=A0A162JG60_9HYPO|nr:ran GTPase activating protein 1 [Niveomyces insectorum RCEF 264]
MAPTKVFSLEGKGLKLDTAADLEPHIAELLTADDIEEVRLLGNTFGVGACKRLGEVLATKKNLQVANLADIFTGRLLSEIPEALSALLTSILNLPKLTTINLNDNAFGLNTQAPVVAFLSEHVPLQHLYLNNNGLGPHAGILVANALSALHARKEEARKETGAAKRFEVVPDLETVVCGRNRLENGSMTAWAAAFKLHNRVREVRMVQNGIRQEGISHLLSAGLHHATDLRVLDLQDNTFTLKGAKTLAGVVPRWVEIVELGIGDSLLSAKGGVLLATALAKGQNKKLQVLRLQYNDLTAPGLKALAQAVDTALPVLQKLEVNGNKFAEDDEAVAALQELFELRKEALGGDVVDEDAWGLDSLSDLDDESEAEEEEEEEEEEGEEEEGTTVEERAEKLLKEAEEAQEEPVIQEKSKEVDALAKQLEKTNI